MSTASLKPLAPAHIAGSRDGSNNLTITWIRRSRVQQEWRDLVDVPLGEASEAYEVDILDGATVVRTIQAATQTAAYSAAEQTTDFGSAQDPVSLVIYQKSATVGRGFPAAGSV